MIPHLKPNTTYAVHLRASSVSGGKDWVGSVTANGEIHTFWGKTGLINQHSGKPGDMAALSKLIDQKQNGKDRYTQIDLYTQKDGWLSQRKPAPPTSPTPAKPAAPLTDWNHSAPDDSIKWDF